jgi:hypothetical protein
MTTQGIEQARAYLSSVGIETVEAPEHLQQRGFAFYAPSVSQGLTEEDVIVFAANEREIRHDVQVLAATREPCCGYPGIGPFCRIHRTWVNYMEGNQQ